MNEVDGDGVGTGPAGASMDESAPQPDSGTAAHSALAAEADPHAATDLTDPVAAQIVSAVDELAALAAEPVHDHASRYHAVHTLLQDALTGTGGTGR